MNYGNLLSGTDGVAMQTPDLVVLQVGLGKAGTVLHAGAWEGLDASVSRIGYDIDPARREAARAAGMLVLESLDELPVAAADLGGRVDIVDITSASGQHASSTRSAQDAINGAGLAMPTAWVLEKPVVSNDDERPVMEAVLDEIGRENVFVNENYLASEALAQAREIIASERAQGNSIAKLVVDFSKDRVADVVLRGRFQDAKGLAVYGIEMPHMLAVASSLVGGELDTHDVSEGGELVANKFYHGIDNIEESEGNYTAFNHRGTKVILKQPLGPFEFDDEGELHRHEWGKDMARTATVTFEDGRTLTILFDPVPGAERYNSKIEYRQADGTLDERIMRDNTLANLLGAVAIFAATEGGQKNALLDVVTPAAAMHYAEQLAELRMHAGDPVSKDSLASFEDTETAAEFSQRMLASYS